MIIHRDCSLIFFPRRIPWSYGILKKFPNNNNFPYRKSLYAYLNFIVKCWKVKDPVCFLKGNEVALGGTITIITHKLQQKELLLWELMWCSLPVLADNSSAAVCFSQHVKWDSSQWCNTELFSAQYLLTPFFHVLGKSQWLHVNALTHIPYPWP